MPSIYNDWTAEECKSKSICPSCEADVNVELDHICRSCFCRLWREGFDPFGLKGKKNKRVYFNETEEIADNEE